MLSLPQGKNINVRYVSPVRKEASVGYPLPLINKMNDVYPPVQGKGINIRYPSLEVAALMLCIPLHYGRKLMLGITPREEY